MLRKLEEALRAALEAPFAQLFPEKLQPLEMAAELRKTMDRSRLLTADGTFVPSSYALALGTEEHAQVAPAVPAIERELAEHLQAFAATENLIVGPHVRVHLYPDAGLTRGQMKVQAEFAPPPPAFLEVEAGLTPLHKRFELSDHMTIGRGTDCEVRIDEPAVSRRHAEIVWLYVLFQVRDLSSANGTFVNGQQVQRAPLRDGDLVEVGLVQLRFHCA